MYLLGVVQSSINSLTASTTFAAVLAVSAAALLVGIVFAWLIGRNIANPIAALTQAMAVLAQ